MREIDKIADNLFEKIRSRFENVNLGDENAKATQDPEQARFFNFDFQVEGEAIGNVTISLIDEESMKVYFGKDIPDRLDQLAQEGANHTDEWYDFLRGLRMFAKRNMLSFDTRDVTKSNLQLKDIKQQSKADATIDSSEINMTESRMYGTSRHSFADVGNCKLRVVHTDSIDEEKRGARSRQIDAIFIETPRGERFRVDHKNISGAAALANHLSSGGEIGDDISECINGMVSEMGNMSHFVRSIKRRTDLDNETSQMAQAAIGRYTELKNHLKNLRSPRHYREFVENYMPEAAAEDEYDVDALRERFVKKMYDDRFDQALPYVYRAHKKQMEAMNTPMAEEFESWAESMVEGTWNMPDGETEVEDLAELLAKPLLVGVNGDDATSALYNLIGDDQLFDDIAELADIKGEDYDCRPEVLKWVETHMPAILAQVTPQPDQPAAEQPAAEPVLGTQQPAELQAAAPAAPEVAPEQLVQSADPLDFIRSLAGLRKNI